MPKHRSIHIPDGILAQLEESLLNDKGREETLREQQAERFRQRLAQLRKRLDQSYVDRLDGKITEEFWEAKSAEWQQEEQTLLPRCANLSRRQIPSESSTAFAF